MAESLVAVKINLEIPRAALFMAAVKINLEIPRAALFIRLEEKAIILHTHIYGKKIVYGRKIF